MSAIAALFLQTVTFVLFVPSQVFVSPLAFSRIAFNEQLVLNKLSVEEFNENMCFSGALSFTRDLLAFPSQDKTAISSFIIKYLSPYKGQIKKV